MKKKTALEIFMGICITIAVLCMVFVMTLANDSEVVPAIVIGLGSAVVGIILTFFDRG